MGACLQVLPSQSADIWAGHLLLSWPTLEILPVLLPSPPPCPGPHAGSLPLSYPAVRSWGRVWLRNLLYGLQYLFVPGRGCCIVRGRVLGLEICTQRNSGQSLEA